jgi:hypothetical protein
MMCILLDKAAQSQRFLFLLVPLGFVDDGILPGEGRTEALELSSPSGADIL